MNCPLHVLSENINCLQEDIRNKSLQGCNFKLGPCSAHSNDKNFSPDLALPEREVKIWIRAQPGLKQNTKSYFGSGSANFFSISALIALF